MNLPAKQLVETVTGEIVTMIQRDGMRSAQKGGGGVPAGVRGA